MCAFCLMLGFVPICGAPPKKNPKNFFPPKTWEPYFKVFFAQNFFFREKQRRALTLNGFFFFFLRLAKGPSVFQRLFRGGGGKKFVIPPLFGICAQKAGKPIFSVNLTDEKKNIFFPMAFAGGPNFFPKNKFSKGGAFNFISFYFPFGWTVGGGILLGLNFFFFSPPF